MTRPLWPLGGEPLAAGLLGVRPAEHVEQLGERGAIAALGRLDHLLHEVVARHVARVDRIHPRRPLTVGERLDTVYARVYTRQGFTLAANDTVTITQPRFDKGSDKKYSMTSASLSVEVIKGVRPYFTIGKPRSFIPGSSGGLSSSTVTSVEILQPSQLEEVGIKGDFLGGKLSGGASALIRLVSA